MMKFFLILLLIGAISYLNVDAIPQEGEPEVSEVGTPLVAPEHVSKVGVPLVAPENIAKVGVPLVAPESNKKLSHPYRDARV